MHTLGGDRVAQVQNHVVSTAVKGSSGDESSAMFPLRVVC